MSPREKKLLTFFAIAGFVMLNLLGLSLFNKKSVEMDGRLLAADRLLNKMQLFEASREQRLDEMEWLQSHLPEPAEYQNVQTALQTYCVAEANRFSLTIKNETSLKQEALDGKHFRRVGIRFKLTGSEESLYRWLDRVNLPNQMRAVTRLILTPNKQDDTLIDCTATIEQWFVPADPTI